MPFDAETEYVRGLTENVTLTGVRPLRVCILTIPLLRSPYSADGTPVMTSIDSMFSTATLLVLAPDISENEALLPNLTPSTSTAVPKAAFPAEEPPSLSDMALAVVRSGLTVLPPGRSAATSVMLDIWRWFNASLPSEWDVPSPSFGLLAVTTTSSRAREFSCMMTLMSAISSVTFMLIETVTYPRHELSSEYWPF